MAEESKRIREEAQDDEPQIQMTPMIDIVFQLLIFFMLACRFRTEEGQMHAFLPKNRGQGTSKSAVTSLYEVRVKLLWVEPNSFRETSHPTNGRVLLKVKDVNIPNVTNRYGEVMPDFDRLYRIICTARDNFPPSENFPTQPVIIDARPLVPFKHIIAALNECVRAQITDITFAAKEIPY